MNYCTEFIYRTRCPELEAQKQIAKEFVGKHVKPINDYSELKVGDYLYYNLGKEINMEWATSYYYKIVKITNKQVIFRHTILEEGKPEHIHLKKTMKDDKPLLYNRLFSITDYIKEDDLDISLPFIASTRDLFR